MTTYLKTEIKTMKTSKDVREDCLYLVQLKNKSIIITPYSNVAPVFIYVDFSVDIWKKKKQQQTKQQISVDHIFFKVMQFYTNN